MTPKSKFYANGWHVWRLEPCGEELHVKECRSDAAAIRHADKLQKAYDKKHARENWSG